jgi:hypothetical protein
MDIFNQANNTQKQWMNFNVIGDCIQGTFIGWDKAPKYMAPGESVDVIQIKANGGMKHDKKEGVLIETPVMLTDGTIYTLTPNKVLKSRLEAIKVGQIIGVKYEGDGPKKKGLNPAKFLNLYTPKNADGTPMVDSSVEVNDVPFE